MSKIAYFDIKTDNIFRMTGPGQTPGPLCSSNWRYYNCPSILGLLKSWGPTCGYEQRC